MSLVKAGVLCMAAFSPWRTSFAIHSVTSSIDVLLSGLGATLLPSKYRYRILSAAVSWSFQEQMRPTACAYSSSSCPEQNKYFKMHREVFSRRAEYSAWHDAFSISLPSKWVLFSLVFFLTFPPVLFFLSFSFFALTRHVSCAPGSADTGAELELCPALPLWCWEEGNLNVVFWSVSLLGTKPAWMSFEWR